MQHIWKVLLTSLLIFALAATACLAEDSEAQYQAYSYTTFSLRRTPSESDRGISVQKKTKILILEWDDAWCKVQVGNKVGYAKPERERPRHQRAEEDKNPHSGMGRRVVQGAGRQ